MFCGFAGHQHGSGHIRGKDGFKTRAVHIDEFLEDAGAGVIHKNVQFGECLKDFAVRPSNVGFVCNIGANRNRMQHLGRFVQLLFISAGDSDACSCINENFGDSESDSAAAACDECRSVPQVHADLPISSSRSLNVGRSPIAIKTSPASILVSVGGLNCITPVLCSTASTMTP